MTTYVEINGKRYPAVITSEITKRFFGGVESKIIKVAMPHAEAKSLFVDDVAWSVVREETRVQVVEDEQGNKTAETVTEQQTTDNSEYCIVDSITDHMNGYVSVKMRKLSDKEMLNIIMGGND